MRNFRRMMWAAAAAALVSGSTASAQFPGGTTGTGGNIGSTTTQLQTTSPTQTTTSTNQSSTTASGGLGTGSLSSGLEQNQNQFELAALKQAPSKTTTNNTAINTSNFLRNSYGSVYYQGSNPLQVPNRIPGSFGTAIYPATGTGGTAGAGGRGAQLGTAGGRGGGALTDPGGQVVPLPRQIAYTSTIQFKSPNGNAMPQLQTDLLGAIGRIPNDMLANPAAVQVAVDGRTVTLKGAVKNEEEARLVEGLVRLTPGVFGIKNELTFVK